MAYVELVKAFSFLEHMCIARDGSWFCKIYFQWSQAWQAKWENFFHPLSRSYSSHQIFMTEGEEDAFIFLPIPSKLLSIPFDPMNAQRVPNKVQHLTPLYMWGTNWLLVNRMSNLRNASGSARLGTTVPSRAVSLLIRDCKIIAFRVGYSWILVQKPLLYFLQAKKKNDMKLDSRSRWG